MRSNTSRVATYRKCSSRRCWFILALVFSYLFWTLFVSLARWVDSTTRSMDSVQPIVSWSENVVLGNPFLKVDSNVIESRIWSMASDSTSRPMESEDSLAVSHAVGLHSMSQQIGSDSKSVLQSVGLSSVSKQIGLDSASVSQSVGLSSVSQQIGSDSASVSQSVGLSSVSQQIGSDSISLSRSTESDAASQSIGSLDFVSHPILSDSVSRSIGFDTLSRPNGSDSVSITRPIESDSVLVIRPIESNALSVSRPTESDYGKTGTIATSVSIQSMQTTPAHSMATSTTPDGNITWVLLVHVGQTTNRWKAITQTWFKKTHPKMALVAFGLTTPPSPPLFALEFTFFQTENVGMFLKTRDALAFCLKTYPRAKYFTKVDDDSYVFTRNFAESLFGRFRVGDYFGYPISPDVSTFYLPNSKIKITERFPGMMFAQGGAGYSLSARAVEALKTCPLELFQEFEDMAVGLCLRFHFQESYHVVDLVGLHAYPMTWFARDLDQTKLTRREPYEGYLKPLTYHHVKPFEMLEMHHDEYAWKIRATAGRMNTWNVPRTIHRFIEQGQIIHGSCAELNPTFEHKIWTMKQVKKLPTYSNELGRPVMFHILFNHGGIFLSPSFVCVKSLDEVVFNKEPRVGELDGFVLYDEENENDAHTVLGFRKFSQSALVLLVESSEPAAAAAASVSPFAFAKDVLEKAQAPIAHFPLRGLLESKRPSVSDDINIRFVVIVHFGSTLNRRIACEQTWFNKTSKHIGFIQFTSVVRDTNLSMFEHTRRAFADALVKYPNAEYFTKTDDDSYLYLEHFYQLLFERGPYRRDYSGFELNPLDEHLMPDQAKRVNDVFPNLRYAQGGSSYTLTRRATKIVATCATHLHQFWEDLAVGLCLKSAFGNDFEMTDLIGLHPHPISRYSLLPGLDELYKDHNYRFKSFLRPLTYHHVKPFEMIEIGSGSGENIPKIIHTFVESEDSIDGDLRSNCKRLHPEFEFITWSRKNLNKLPKAKLGVPPGFLILLHRGGVFLENGFGCGGERLNEILRGVATWLEFSASNFNSKLDGFLLGNETTQGGDGGVYGFRKFTGSILILIHEWDLPSLFTNRTGRDYVNPFMFAVKILNQAEAPVMYLV